MDQQRDFHRFQRLIGRLCETMGKPVTDELVESWWKSLRHVDFDTVSDHVDRFLAKADEGTRFPRPSQMRPKNLAPREELDHDPLRGYWRSAVVNDCCNYTGYSIDGFERALIEHRETLAPQLRGLIDELCAQDVQTGRTDGMHKGCRRRVEEIINRFGIKELERA